VGNTGGRDSWEVRQLESGTAEQWGSWTVETAERRGSWGVRQLDSRTAGDDGELGSETAGNWGSSPVVQDRWAVR
jgi:hypothetical protein